MRNDAPLMERLSAKATWQPNGCWEWNKPQPSGLCGTLMVDDPVSGKRRQIMASVVSWLNKHGSMPRAALYRQCQTTNCINPDHYIESEYQIMTIEEYFRSKVKVNENGCWDWQGTLFATGYGHIYFAWPRKKKRSELAHRVSWFLAFGVEPKLHLLHSCDRPICVNPDHLSEGTQADNMRDMFAKKRNGAAVRTDWSHWVRGEKNNNAKLTEDQVANIRSRHAAGGITAALIARDYGVSPTTVVRILQGKTWKHGGRV